MFYARLALITLLAFPLALQAENPDIEGFWKLTSIVHDDEPIIGEGSPTAKTLVYAIKDGRILRTYITPDKKTEAFIHYEFKDGKLVMTQLEHDSYDAVTVTVQDSLMKWDNAIATKWTYAKLTPAEYADLGVRSVDDSYFPKKTDIDGIWIEDSIQIFGLWDTLPAGDDDLNELVIMSLMNGQMVRISGVDQKKLVGKYKYENGKVTFIYPGPPPLDVDHPVKFLDSQRMIIAISDFSGPVGRLRRTNLFSLKALKFDISKLAP